MDTFALNYSTSKLGRHKLLTEFLHPNVELNFSSAKIDHNNVTQQDHHHNGDQTARRSHRCSICVHSFGDLTKAVVRLYVDVFSSSSIYNRLAEILKDGFSPPPVWELREGVRGLVPPVPMFLLVPCSATLGVIHKRSYDNLRLKIEI